MKNKKQSLLSRIFIFGPTHKKQYILGLFMGILFALASSIPFIGIMKIIEAFTKDTLQREQVMLYITIIVISIVVGLLLSIGSSILCHKVAFSIIYDIRTRFLKQLGHIRMDQLVLMKKGAIQKVLDENMTHTEQFIAHNFPSLLQSISLFIFSLGLMFYYNIWLALLTMVIVIIAYAIQFASFGGNKGKTVIEKYNQNISTLNSKFDEYIQGIEEEKIFQPYHVNHSIKNTIHETTHWMKMYLKRVSVSFGLFKTITLSLGGIIIAGGAIASYFTGFNPSFGLDLILFFILSPAIYNYLYELVAYGSEVTGFKVRLLELEQYLEVEITEENGAIQKLPDGDMKINQLSFSYYQDQSIYALDHINLTIPKGKITAFVGGSGGGKSTLAQLLLRFYEPTEGNITIGDVNIQDVPLSSLMSHISFVFQNPHIFSTSVYENIKMNGTHSKEEVIAAAKKARIHSFIMQLPKGYDTILGDEGQDISGGEAQRIAIARAILKDAPILIFDEGFSFADAENEVLIYEALQDVMKEKTVIIIAHRLYSIQKADQIVVIEKGTIVEKGTHEKLLEQKSRYFTLWNIQNEINEWSIGGQHV